MKSQVIFSPSGTSLFQHPNPVNIPYPAHSGHSAQHSTIEETGHCLDRDIIGDSTRSATLNLIATRNEPAPSRPNDYPL